MRNKANKDLILFLILIPLFLIISFFISSRLENKLPNSSVINKTKGGYSILFEALRELQYPVDRSFNKVSTHGVGYIQMVADHQNFDINDRAVKEWIGKGGVVVYLTLDIKPDIHYGIKYKEVKEISQYEYQEGSIIVANADILTNKTLMEDTSGAYQLIQVIDQHRPYEKIIFNEGYLYSIENKLSLWTQIPMAWKYVIYQVVLMLAAYFYYKGKTFGKPIPLHEEVERLENEYLYASAALYRQAKSWDLMLEIYYKSFLKELNAKDDEWLERWKRHGLPHMKKAEKLYQFMQIGQSKKQSKLKEKEYMEMVMILEQLRDVLKKGRDTFWKITKEHL